MEDFEEPQVQYGDFGTRLLAQIIDGIIASLFFGVIFFLLLALFFTDPEPDFADQTSVFWLFGFILYYLFGLPLIHVLYGALFEGSKRQATPGKIIMKLKVVNKNYEPISLAHAFGRNFSKLLSGFLLIGYFIALGNDKVQTLHDQIAGTYVIFKS